MKALQIGFGAPPYYIVTDVSEAMNAVVEAFGEQLEDSELGLELSLKVISITEKELDDLPEFEGF